MRETIKLKDLLKDLGVATPNEVDKIEFESLRKLAEKNGILLEKNVVTRWGRKYPYGIIKFSSDPNATNQNIGLCSKDEIIGALLSALN